MTNYTKIAVKGTIIVLVVSLLAGFLGYLVRLVLARNLTVEDFGLFNAVFAFLGMLGVFKSLGFDKALIKFIPDFKHENRKDFIKTSIVYVTIIQLITNIIIIVGVYLLSSYLSIKFFHSPKANVVLKLLVISFSLDSFVFVLKFAFQGFKEMTYYSGIDVVRMLLVLAITMIGFKLNYGLLSPVAGYITAHLILLFFFGWIFFRNVFPDFNDYKFVFDKALLKRISKYSIFVVETSAASLLLYYTDVLALTYFSDLKSVGLYSVALPTAKVLLFFPRAIGGILWPLSSELWAERKEAILKAGIESLYKYSLILMVPLAFTMFSFTDLLISVLYGKNYILASGAMKILSIGMVFAILYGINISFFAGIGKPQISSRIVYTAAIFNLVTNIVLIPIIGILGAALATTASYFIMMAMGLFYMKKLIKIRFPVELWIKTLGIGLIFIFIIWALKKVLFLNVWVETAIVLVISCISYIALLFLLKVVDIRELKDLYRRIVK